jgi:hypothetical protein
MAKVRNNIFVRGLSGAVGDQFVIKTTRSGKTIIANMPTFGEDRIFSEAQTSHQSAFREASAYARSSKTQPVCGESQRRDLPDHHAQPCAILSLSTVTGSATLPISQV